MQTNPLILSMTHKLTPVLRVFVAIVTLLFIQFLFLSNTSIIARVIGLILIVVLAYYGAQKNNNVRVNVPHKQMWTAFLWGGLCITLGTLIMIIWESDTVFSQLYLNVSLAHLIYIIIIAPIGEEMIYRQLLYKDAFTHIWVGRIVSGVLFIAIHTPNTLPTLLFYTLATIGLSITYENSGNNIWTAIGVHIVNNAVAVFL